MTQDAQITKTTPMMAQWEACKEAAQNAVLFFRMGDFYEAFHQDAITIAKELGLTLTKRQGIPMAGVPVHTRDSHVDKLVSKGHRVAIAEQMEDPRQTKGLVRREVVRLVTPGTLVDSNLLKDKKNNYFVCILKVGAVFGLAHLDLSTSEFRVIEFHEERELLDELYRLRPAEMLMPKRFLSRYQDLVHEVEKSCGSLINTQDEWHFDHQTTYNFLLEHFGLQTLDGFGLKGMVSGVHASGALLAYFRDELRLPIQAIRSLGTYNHRDYMSLDRTAQRNLELTESLQDGSRKNSLLSLMDHTHTPMGGRLLYKWLKQPLLCPAQISQRQDAVEFLLRERALHETLLAHLEQIRDLERIMMKVATGYNSARDLVNLRLSLHPAGPMSQLLASCSSVLLSKAGESMLPPEALLSLIGQALVDEPPLKLGEGKTFREGYHQELDELCRLKETSQDWLGNYQQSLREQLGIRTLKVGYNRVFGYYIEVSKGQSHLMPEDRFTRRQTLTNSERFISGELREFEQKIFSAEEQIAAIEADLYAQLREEVLRYTDDVRRVAAAIAEVDCFSSLAHLARERAYIRPTVDDSYTLQICQGRHPVIEASMYTENFVANDTCMNNSDHRLLLITGPNMAGKSTYIRQVALLCIMAQMGSFIPAKSAHMGIVDRLFTRIGASDDLSRGQSTFMVEMTETANILHNASSRSLIILDEIGRGTSTYDGISIAWAVGEFLIHHPEIHPKVLFATHYWELTKLEEKCSGAVNYHVAVDETEGDVTFLHKIVRGDADQSYGIHVAKLAGLPDQVIQRAKEILEHLEDEGGDARSFDPQGQPRRVLGTPAGKDDDSIQLLLFEPYRPKKQRAQKTVQQISDLLRGTDVEELSLQQAQAQLSLLKQMIASEESREVS